MRILHRYLTQQVLGALTLTVAVFTFVLLLGNVLKEVLGLMVSHQANWKVIVHAISLLIPYVLVFALPMGILTATLLVFGRFSADQELTAARASGISLVALTTPVFLLATAITCLCGVINMQVAPSCRVAYKNLLFRLGFQKSAALFENMERRFITEFQDYVLYAGKVRNQTLEDVLFYQLKNGQTVLSLSAPRAKFWLDETNRSVWFQFFEASVALTPEGFKDPEQLPATSNSSSNTNTNTVSSPLAQPTEWQVIYADEYGPVSVSLGMPGQRTRKAKLSELTFSQLLAERRQRARQGISTTPVEVELHRQVAFSFASLSFALVGVPLGIRAHRRETNIGVALALALLLLYYSFIIMGQALETRAHLYPQLIIWLPNLLFQCLGVWLLSRANSVR